MNRLGTLATHSPHRRRIWIWGCSLFIALLVGFSFGRQWDDERNISGLWETVSTGAMTWKSNWEDDGLDNPFSNRDLSNPAISNPDNVNQDGKESDSPVQSSENRLDVSSNNERRSGSWNGWIAIAAVAILLPFFFSSLRRKSTLQFLDQSVADIIQTVPQGLLILDHRGSVLVANATSTKILGLDANRIVGRPASSLPWCTRHSKSTDDPWHQALTSIAPVDEQWMRYQVRGSESQTIAVGARQCPSENGGMSIVVVSLKDVTDQQRREGNREHELHVLRAHRSTVVRHNEELQELASTDPLTNCLNRRSFFSRFESIWNNQYAGGDFISVVMVDIDFFKRLNDDYGHEVGDEVLRQVSAELRAWFGHPARVCRYGGEEFCILLPGFDLEQAAQKAETARHHIAALTVQREGGIRVTCSMGVATRDSTTVTPTDLIGQADRRLYVAKESGRNRVVAMDDQGVTSEV